VHKDLTDSESSPGRHDVLLFSFLFFFFPRNIFEANWTSLGSVRKAGLTP